MDGSSETAGAGAGAGADDGRREHLLLSRHRDGDASAFAQLVQLYRARVFNYFMRCGIDRASGEDLLQDTFIKVHAGAATYSPDRPLKAWIFTIAANTARSYFRKQSVRGKVVSKPDADGRSATPDGLQMTEAHEAAQWLTEAVQELPLQQREIVLLSCIEKIPHKEIATILEIPENSVKTNLRRARLTLAKELVRRRVRADREVGA